MTQRIGIMDIGSNSVRLVIYEKTGQSAYRVIDESKESARLSERIGSDGKLPDKEIAVLIEILLHFKRLCDAQQVTIIRAVATAAVRNAVNSDEIVARIHTDTRLHVEIITGEEEARIGFLGMINSVSLTDGLLIDIGGGSTELTLFRNRTILHSVSFPFGAVNTTKKYTTGGNINEEQQRQIVNMVERALLTQPWIKEAAGHILVGIGGTNRTMGKLIQRMKQYSLPLAHHYETDIHTVAEITQNVTMLNVEKRKKVDGLSKDRVDIIAAGLLILRTIAENSHVSDLLISGAGLRDGIFYETAFPDCPVIANVVEHSVENLLGLHPSAALAHVRQVNRLALQLFDSLEDQHGYCHRTRLYLHAASLLYRIGVTIDYYHFDQHTFYLFSNSRLDGLSHREILLGALIASYKSKNRARQQYLKHRDILNEEDFTLAVHLGTLLQLAIAMDRSETQPVIELYTTIASQYLLLQTTCSHTPLLELKEVHGLRKEFQKVWGLHLQWTIR